MKRSSLSLSKSENNQAGASLGRLLYDSVSSEKVSFSARKVIREVTSPLDCASVIVTVGEYKAEGARGDPW